MISEIGQGQSFYLKQSSSVGPKIAVVRSYRAKQAQTGWQVELHGVYPTDDAFQLDIDCFKLSDFDFIAQKHDRTIIYTGCSWADRNDVFREKYLIVARNRQEIPKERRR